MIRLTNTTTDLLAATPSSTNVVKTLVHFSDSTASAYTGGNEPHSLAAASKATICATPSASTVRDIDHVIICATGGANTITIEQTVSGTDYQITQAVLATNETLEYTHAGGWRTLDANGSPKTTQGGWTIAAGKAGILSNSLTFAGTDGTTMTFPSTSASIARTDADNSFAATQSIAKTGTAFFNPTVTDNTTSGLAGTTAQTNTATATYGIYFRSNSPANTASRYGLTVGGYGELAVQTNSNGLIIGGGLLDVPVIFVTNNAEIFRFNKTTLTVNNVNMNLGTGTITSNGSVGLSQASTATLGKSITVVNGLVTAFA